MKELSHERVTLYISNLYQDLHLDVHFDIDVNCLLGDAIVALANVRNP